MFRFALVLVLSLFSASAFAEVRVVASITDLAAIAAEVGGERVNVEALAAASEDPHFVDAKPSHIVSLNRADLLIFNGLELEIGWLPTLITQARNAKLVPGSPGYLDASEFVDLMDVPAGAVDRSMGDVHPGGNPHFTSDPRAAYLIAQVVRDRLIALDPEGSAHYTARTATFLDALVALNVEQTARFEALSANNRRVLLYHASVIYLLNWLGLTSISTVEPRPGIPPDPRRVAEVLQTMRDSGVLTIVQEEYYPSNTSQNLAQLAGGRVVSLEGGTRFPNESYIEHVRKLANSLYEAVQ